MSLAFSDVNAKINDGLLVEHTVKTAAYTALKRDVIIGADTTGGILTITLPSAQTVKGKIYIINDEGGAAATNTITIATEGSETIDGSATATIVADDASLRLYSNGSNWFSY